MKYLLRIILFFSCLIVLSGYDQLIAQKKASNISSYNTHVKSIQISFNKVLADTFFKCEQKILAFKPTSSTSRKEFNSKAVGLINDYFYYRDAVKKGFREDVLTNSFSRRYQKYIGNFLSFTDVSFLFNSESYQAKHEEFAARSETLTDYDIYQVNISVLDSAVYTYLDSSKSQLRQLPDDWRQKFKQTAYPNRYEVNIKHLLPQNHHLVTIQSQRVIDITIYPQKLLEKSAKQLQPFFEEPPDYNRKAIEFDIQKFLANYITSMTINDRKALAASWSEIAVCQFKAQNQKNYMSIFHPIGTSLKGVFKSEAPKIKRYDKKNALERIVSKYQRPDTWGFLEVTGNINFYVLDEKSTVWKREINGKRLSQKTNFLMNIPLREIFLDFSDKDKRLEKIDVKDIQLLLNVLNIENAKKRLTNNQPLDVLDGFGIWSYLGQILQKDDYKNQLKEKLLKKYQVLNALKNEFEIPPIDEPSYLKSIEKITDFINAKKNRKALLAFLKSQEHNSLRLQYNPYQQSFIQIVSANYVHDDEYQLPLDLEMAPLLRKQSSIPPYKH